MKEGWKEDKLSDVCNIINGRAYLKPEMLSEGKYRILRVGNFFTNDNWYYSNLELDDDKYCEEGDLLYAWSASFGPRIWHGEKVIFHYHIWKMICSDCLDKKYMYYWLDSDALKKQVMSQLHGATMTHITKGIMEKCIVSYPPLSEQQRIVSRLDASFAKIDALSKQAEEALEHAKALFQAKLKELMETKEGWEEKKFGEVCKYHKENGIHKGLRYIGLEHIEQATGKLITTISSDTVLSNTFKFAKGDVLYGRLRPYLKKVVIADDEGCCSTEIFPITSNTIIPGFIKYWFLTDNITNMVNATCAGCRMPRGNMNDVLRFEMSFPSIPEQQQIVQTLDSLSERIQEIQQIYNNIIANCQALKQALLSETFE